MSFSKHPSQLLQNFYKEKYWQCQNPENAKVIFLSLDANWDKNVEDLPIFPEIVSYLRDGVAYWEQRGIHHPFLLPEYKRGDGYTFHRNFSKLNLAPQYAQHISFIELLNLPTVGISTKDEELFINLFDLDYLKKLDSILFDDREKLVFMPKKVFSYLKMLGNRYDIFNKVMIPENTTGQEFINIYNKGNRFFFVCNHFSASNFNSFYENMGIIAMSFLAELGNDIWWKVFYVSSHDGQRFEDEQFIKAANIIEVKKILCKHMGMENVETELRQLNICPVLQEENINPDRIWF